MTVEAREEGRIEGLVKRVKTDARTVVSGDATAGQRAGAIVRTTAVGAAGVAGAAGLADGIHLLAGQDPGLVHALTTGVPATGETELMMMGGLALGTAAVVRVIRPIRDDVAGRERMSVSFRRIGVAVTILGGATLAGAGIVGGGDALGVIHGSAHQAIQIASAGSTWVGLGIGELLIARAIRPAKRAALPSTPTARLLAE